LTGKATALDGFNQFEIRYQAFQGDGKTDDIDFPFGSFVEWKLEVRLTQDVEDDYKVKILDILDRREVGYPESVQFPRVEAKQRTQAYTLPTTVADPTGKNDWVVGQWNNALCRTEVPLGSDNYWYRTRLGWVDASAFSIEKLPDGHPGSVRWVDAKPSPCPKFAAQRAIELERAAE
jgi:hypothetical protein